MDIWPVSIRQMAKGAAWLGRGSGRSIVLVLPLLVICLASLPAASPARAAADAVRWTKVNIPAAGDSGKWVLAPGSDVRQLVAAADDTLYAAARGLTYTLYSSTDGGRSWSPAGKVQDDIVAIAVPPGETGLVYYATTAAVFRSKNGGRTFEPLPAGPGEAGSSGREITSLAVARGDSDIVAVGVRDTGSAEFGGVYTLDEAEVVPAWADTGLGAFDAWAIAFSPGYDRQLMAVVTDETESYVFTRTGDGAWNAGIGAAKLARDKAGSPVAVGRSAVIAFPDSYDKDVYSPDSDFYVAIDTGVGDGGVYRIRCAEAPDVSLATDLNIDAAYGGAGVDITGLAASGEGAKATLLAGAADSRTYISTDGGGTWTRSRKGPTGGSGTAVLLPPDFANTGLMYAATSGTESAVSISEDKGATWDQVSLIDTGLDAVLDLAPSPDFKQDGTLFLLTFGGRHSLWRSRDAGVSWERVICGDPSGGDVLARVALPPDYGEKGRNVYVAGESGGTPAVWESADNGQTFRRRFTRDPTAGEPFSIDAWTVTGETSLIIGGYDGSHGLVYPSSSGGFVYSEGTPVGNLPLSSIAVSPDFDRDQTILAGDTGGRVYLSRDGGLSFDPVPHGAAPLDGAVTAAFDPAFASDHAIYAISDAAGDGIYRLDLDSDDAWQEIDAAASPSVRFAGLTVSGNGTLYAASSAAGGGLERSLDPRSASGATFETVTRGLDASATLLGLWSSGGRLWSLDATGNTLLTFHDTLTSAVAITSPDDGAGSLGSLVDHGARDIRLDWEAVEGATGYEWQCNYENDFSDIPDGLSGSVSASMVRLPELEPATTYYWRVRASAPVLGPWSEKRSFTTGLDTEVIALGPQIPAPGATGVPVEPFFQWTAVAGAESYELLVSSNIDFSEPSVSRTLPTNAWQCEVTLAHAATYYWKVRAATQNTRSAWGATGVFTTAPEPEPSTPSTTTTPPVHEINLPAPAPTTPPTATPALHLQTAPPSPPPPVSSILPAIDAYYSLPAWIIYLIGALVLTVILALFVVLAMVQKIRR